MTDNRKAAIALIVGSIGGVLAMAVHPHGAGTLTSAQVEHLALVSAVAHTVALLSILLLFLGSCGLNSYLADRELWSFAALATFGFASVAVMIAGAISGYIIPSLMRHMLRDVPDAAHQWQIVIDAVFQCNQAFSRIYSVATGIAIALWSFSALRNRRLSAFIAHYGWISSLLIIVGTCVGHIRLDVHGMAIVAVSEVIWFVAVAVVLLRPSSRAKLPLRSEV